MKRIRILLVLSLAAALFITACADGKKLSGNPTEESTSDESKKYITVGFSQVGSESDWRIACSNSYYSVFTEENGYHLLFEDGQQKQENQLKSIRSFILQDVDYIVLDPIVETGWDSVLEEARDAGIPVIICDREVNVEDDTLYECWIGSDFKKEGRKAGEWLEKYLEQNGRSDEDINLVTLQGTLDSSAQLGRTKGFGEVLSQHSNWHMLDRESGDFTQAKGQEVMEHFLDKYDDIDVVISENDNMTFGAINAIHAAGKTCGPDGDIIILSFDAVKAALEDMSAGEINADFECNPSLASLVSDNIKKIEKGEKVDKIQYVPEKYFDTDMDLGEIMKTRTY